MSTHAAATQSSPTSAGSLLQLIRTGTAVTRADIARQSGLARSTVAQRIDDLIRLGLVYEAGGAVSTGGRPPVALAFNSAAGFVLSGDLGATHVRAAIHDLGGSLLAERAGDIDIADGPELVLGWLADRFEELLEDADHKRARVRAIGIGLPGPVDFDTGRPVSPPIMPGWDGFSLRDWFASRYAAPVFVDNDVNIMARGEHAVHWRDVQHLLMVKVGTGIGCGIVVDGHIHHGAHGAAGDIGHIRVTNSDVVCRCGNTGCLEAVAGGQALAVRLRAEGLPVRTSREVADLVRSGNPDAIRMVRDAGRKLGEVMAGIVNFFNPSVIVLGGDIATAHEHLLAGVREGVFSRSLPLATRDLRIVISQLGDRSGVIGAATMAIDQILSPVAVDAALA